MQELNEEHDALLARLDEFLAGGMSSDEAMQELQIPVREFIASVADGGRDLYLDQERSAAQSLLHYWSNALTRAGVEYLPASLLPFDEEGGSTDEELDFPFDLIGRNRRLRWDQYAAGRRLRDDARKVWDVMPLIAIVGSIGSGRGTALKEVIVPAVIEWMTLEAGVPPQLIHFPAEGGTLGPLFAALRANTSESKKPTDNPLRRLAEGQTDPGGILLVIHDLGALLHDLQDNQWEEWLRALLEWARKPNGVVLVVNNSRLHLLTDHAEFQREVIKQQVTAVYDSAELREFVEMPARAARVYFEEGVVERIVRNVQGQHGTLALLHFSLQRIWEVFRKRSGHKLIRHVDYEQVSSGRTAVDRAAEEALEGLCGSLAAVEKLFLHLVTPALEGWDIHEVPIDKLREDPVVSERVDAIVTAFAAAKILRFCEGEPGERRVALYHYVIAGCWARLQSWLEGAREKSLAHLLLPRVARRWARENMPGDSLWRGEMLSSVERQAAQKSPLEQRFIAAVGVMRDVGHVLAAHVHVRRHRGENGVLSEHAHAAHLEIAVVGRDYEARIDDQTAGGRFHGRLLGEDETNLGTVGCFFSVGRVVHLQNDVVLATD